MEHFQLLKTEGSARRGSFATNRGTFQTPAFMNVATAAAIKGGLDSQDLKKINCQVMLCNTYHLHLRPTEAVVNRLGGISGMTGWDGPTLTDSGGFQVFSLAKLRNIKEEGVSFNSHINGAKLFMSPEISMQIQSSLGSSIAMAFDECMPNPSPYDYAKASCERTYRWLVRCKTEHDYLNSLESTINKQQLLFGINQGCCYDDLRAEHMKKIAELDLDGYAIGGLAVGEPAEMMYSTIENLEPHMPKNKIRYLMGVGTPVNILEAVYRGVDLFDCVMPARNGRHGHIFTKSGIINIKNAKYALDDSPIDKDCDCYVCRNYSRAYINHLFKADEMLGLRFAVMHNLYFYNNLLFEIRAALDQNKFNEYYINNRDILDKRI